jgi:hypothetical protein
VALRRAVAVHDWLKRQAAAVERQATEILCVLGTCVIAVLFTTVKILPLAAGQVELVGLMLFFTHFQFLLFSDYDYFYKIEIAFLYF